MRKDFTINAYKNLLDSLIYAGFSFQTYGEFTEYPNEKVILLRHDVDARKEHSLQFAKIQHEKEIKGTYYFRMVPQSFDEGVIREIASMGHEIGYHYEDMDFAKGDVDKAYELAKKHLEKLRAIADVQTICMHGSPRSPYDNKDVWKKYDYRELGIIAEPYFDLDFSKVLYLTDTGRRWDGEGVSIRDKAPVRGEVGESESGRVGEGEMGNRGQGSRVPEVSGLRSEPKAIPAKRKASSRAQDANSQYSLLNTHYYHSTHDIINACKSGKLPDQIMMNFHPQRWTDHPVRWTQELVWQNVKNVVKGFLVRFRD